MPARVYFTRRPREAVIVLGLNAYGHDAAAVLMVDGEVVFASSQERYDRRRHSPAYPREAIAAALEHAGLRAADVDAVAFPWTRDMGRRQKFWHVLKGLPRSRAYFRDPPDSLLPDRQGYLKAMRGLEAQLLAEGFTAPLDRVPHHEAHAASGTLALPEGCGGVLTADGMGEWTTAAAWGADDHHLDCVRRAVYPHSPGKAYAAVTQWLGFTPESGEGKTMGLAAYGSRETKGHAFGFGLLGAGGRDLLRVDLRKFGFPWGEARLYGKAFLDTLGPARGSDEPIRDGDADVALGIQEAVTIWAALIVKVLADAAGEAPVALSGGLFLNCAMNGELLRAGYPVRPFPVAGDAGAAWGAAASVHRRLTGTAAAPLDSLYLGHEITADEARVVGEREGFTQHEDVAALADAAAERIANGEILAVARERAEFGPRALGNRSVLASPTTRASRDRVNELKGRESWRPVAPIVKLEDARWFDGQVASRYMILTFEATERARREIPGVIHEDGTARVQTVAEGENELLRALLDALEARGHPPVVINTSLNRRGEPIVNTAEEALTAARAMKLDGVIVGDWIGSPKT